MPSNTAALPDALREALGQVIANERREWRRERELIEAQSRETVAELKAKVIELETAVKQSIAERLASLKDGEPGAPGKACTADDVAPLIASEVTKAVALIPVPKDGEPGKSVGLDDVAPMIASEVEKAVTALPPAKEGAPGKSLTADDVAPLIVSEVSKAVAALPPAPSGKDADPELVRQLVTEAVNALPPAPAGKDADPAVIRDMIAAAAAGLPRPKDGEPGPEGPPGKLPIVKVWSDGVHYEGAVVTHNGGSYQALKDTGREPPGDDWLCLAAAGKDGGDGRSFTVRGTWDADTEYRSHDVVALHGGSFVAKKDNPGPCPGEGWQLLASQGKPGRPGDRGAPGLKGDRGLPGPSVAGLDVDDNGLLTLTNGDGSTVTCDFYPLLAKLSR